MPESRVHSLLERIADALLAHRGKMLLAVLLVTAGLGYASRDLSISTSPETLLETDDPGLRPLRSHEREFGSFEHRVLLVEESDRLFSPRYLREVAAATEAIRALPEVARVRSLTHSGFPLPDPQRAPEEFRRAALANRLITPFLVSGDGRTWSIQVDLTEEADTPGCREEAIRKVRETCEPAFYPAVTGIPAIRREYASYIWTSVIVLPPIEIVVLGLILIFAIRRILPLFALLGVICFASFWTVGIIALTGGRITALTSIIPPLIMVVGIAGGIHVVARFLEERGHGAEPRAAARAAFIGMAVPCGLTALTTAVGFSSLLIAGIRDVREFGIYSAAGALLTFFMGLPVMTVVLSYLGDRKRERCSSGLPVGRPLAWLARFLSRRPLLGVAMGISLVAAAVPGILALENETFLLEDIRETAPIQQTTRLVDEKLGGVIGFDLLVDSPDGALSPKVLPFLSRLEERLRGIEGVRGVLGPATLLEEAAAAVGAADLDPASAPFLLAAIEGAGGGDVVSALYDDKRRRARIAVRTGDVGSRRSRELQATILSLAAEERPPGTTTRLAGLHVLAETVLARLVAEMVKSTLLAFAVVLLLMTLIHRSIRIGLLSMVPNFLPLFVAAGFMGYAGITVRSSMALIFAVALGIAVDDTIHILHRYRAGQREGLSRDEAISGSILRTGRPVVLSSVVLIVGFLCYMFMSFKATQQFGMVAAVTIAAALVGDLLLLPAMLHLGARRRRPSSPIDRG